MNITIQLVTEDIYHEIYKFEEKNRKYFESILPPRPPSYHHYDTFKTVMDGFMVEQNRGDFYMHIIRNEAGVLVGRINLQRIDSKDLKKAEIGYRIDFDHQGLGYGSQGVKLMVRKGFQVYELDEITAGTAKDNLASRKVLEKNGFLKIYEEKKVVKINNQWLDGILYTTRNNLQYKS